MSASTPVPKPPIVTTALTSRCWEAAGRGELLVQRCRACSHSQHYPRAVCARCWSDDLVDVISAGYGIVRSFTVIRSPGHPAWRDDVPYVVALVTLREGPSLTTNIVGCDPDAVRVGQPVVLRPTASGGDGPTLLTFAPDPAASA